MIKVFFRNLPPMPRNNSHIKTRHGYILSDMARMFKEDVTARLASVQWDEYFNKAKEMAVTVVVHTPKEKYFTKEEVLSKTSIDMDAHKCLLDCIADFFKFNDGIISDFRVVKTPIDGDWCFEIELNEIEPEITNPLMTEVKTILNLSKQGFVIL